MRVSSLVLSAILILIAKDVIADMKPNPRPKEPHTSFQTPTGYMPENDIRTDAVIVYSCEKDRTQSWIEKGYVAQTMYGFRTGPDYIKDHADEGQTMSNGEILTCGPGSYYMVPTQSRIDAALAYFRQAMDGGSAAVIPEEPEFFTITGYSESFKREWQAYYGEPWQDQTTSIEARWKSDRLKGYLEYRMVKSILEDAEKHKPDAVRMVAAHSPVSYYNWGIIYPHYQVLQLPQFQEMIGQVWTGTARSACKYEGVMAERTFENGYLEYSSLYNLTRGTGKRMWFLMDPLEDNPDRTMEDYQTNYEKTLVASLMFPEIDEYEVMPWPTRIFGRVPPEFATKIMTIVTMLGDVHNQKDSELDAGTQGIATFVADSMAWQRGEPSPSTFDSFYGLTLPLVMKGIPVQVAQLERTTEPKYLGPYKVILLSYDMMKPMDPTYNEALAKWVKGGGTLVLFGGTDAYNDLPEWWKKDGFESPQDHLLAQLGVRFRDSVHMDRGDKFEVLASENKPYRNLENRKPYTLDLSKYVLADGDVYVKVQDSQTGGGWGPQVFSAELRVDGKTVVSFKAGSEAERKCISEDGGSIFNGVSRFADGQSFWIYRFPTGAKSCCAASSASCARKVELVLDMGNQFRVSAATTPPSSERRLVKAAVNPLTGRYPRLTIPSSNEITAYDADVAALYSIKDMQQSPFFEANVGKGTLIFCGIAPKYFALSKESAELLRAIAAYGCGKAGIEYRESDHMLVRRGRYVAVRTLDRPIVCLMGNFVDVLDPKIRQVTNPSIPQYSLAVYADVADRLADSKPRILLSSSRIEASSETASETKVLLSGPLGTRGIVRLSTAGKRVKSVAAEDSAGKPVPVEYKLEDWTLAVTYDDLPSGVLVQVVWE